MALFHFGKKKEPKHDLPPFKPMDESLDAPRFPEFEKEEFPSYKPAVSEDTIPEIPIRKPSLLRDSSTDELDRRMPVFVKINKYKAVKTSLNDVKNLLKGAERAIEKLEEIKREEDEELSIWHQNLEEIKERLVIIDEKLFET